MTVGPTVMDVVRRVRLWSVLGLRRRVLETYSGDRTPGAPSARGCVEPIFPGCRDSEKCSSGSGRFVDDYLDGTVGFYTRRSEA